MKFIDFEYDGQRLSDYECIVCRIINGGDAGAIKIGSQLTFNTMQTNNVNKFRLMSTQYDEPCAPVFEITKFNCKNPDENTFTQEEISQLKRWLNKKQFKKFKPVYEDGELAEVYYNASFNIDPIVFYSNIIGLQLTMQTDAPYAYYDEVEHVMEFTSDNLDHSYFDTSDEIGYIYPSSMIIEFLENGNFEMTNSQEPERITCIKNCIKGEVITLVENKVISSSAIHNTLYNDFNYVFPRICNKNEDIYGYGYSDDNMENIFTVNMPCKITFKYSPICKAGMIC